MSKQQKRTQRRRIIYGKNKLFTLISDVELVQKLRDLSFSEDQPITCHQIMSHPTLQTELGFRGFVETGKRSFIDGLQTLGFTYQRARNLDPEAALTDLLEKEYSRDRVASALRGETTLLTPKEFRREHPQAYNSMNSRRSRRRYGNDPSFPDRLRALHIDLFEGQMYPNLYAYITANTTELDTDVLRQALLDRFSEGFAISPSLKNGTTEERRLFNAVNTVGARYVRERMSRENEHLFSKKRKKSVRPAFVQTVARLTGLHPAYISRKESAVAGEMGELGELFTKFMLYWTKVIDETGDVYKNGFSHFFPTPLGIISPGVQGRVSLVSYDRRGRLVEGRHNNPDIRIDDWAVEVKCGAAMFTPARVEEIITKYQSDSLFEEGRYWVSGEVPRSLDDLVEPHKLAGSTVIFHTPRGTHEHAIPLLEKEQFRVLTPEKFADYLEKLVCFLEEQQKENIQSSVAGAYDLKYLLKLYDTLVHQPHLLERPSNRLQLKWSRDLLRQLVTLGEIHAYHDYDKELPTPIQTPLGISRFLGGKVQSSAYGSYLYVTRPLEEINCPSIQAYIAKHASRLVEQGWNAHHYQRFMKKPDIAESNIPLENILFLDIEAAAPPGREFSRGESVPFVIGTMRYQNDHHAMHLYISRNPSEEPAALAALAQSLEDISLMVTFNGRAYDCGVLEQRMHSHTIPGKLPPHLDLLPIVKNVWRQRLPNYKLRTIERIRYGHKREGDILGSEIGGAYQAFLETADPTDMKRITNHNAIDLAVTGAMFYDVHRIISKL